MIADLAGWVAPAATMIAAMMTAANLGARITGWGFVVFTIGSVGWSIVGLSSGQTNLVATNAFLTLVNGVGIWRWLGRQRVYEDGGKAAQTASRRSGSPTLFTATGLAGMRVLTSDGRDIGKSVEALLECGTGTVSYVVVASGGVGGVKETLRAVPAEAVRFDCEELRLSLSSAKFEQLDGIIGDEWPASPPRHDVGDQGR
jgi:sporulation protein YlmC with PRC-barrel domain